MNVVVSILMTACSSRSPSSNSPGSSPAISEENAKEIAKQFIKERTRFFSKTGNYTVNLTIYEFDKVTVNDTGSAYDVSLHITATLENTTKENTLIVMVDKKSGRVLQVNGRRVLFQ